MSGAGKSGAPSGSCAAIQPPKRRERCSNTGAPTSSLGKGSKGSRARKDIGEPLKGLAEIFRMGLLVSNPRSLPNAGVNPFKMQARRSAVALLASLRTVPAAAGRVSALCVAPRRSFPGIMRAPLSRGFSDAAGAGGEAGGEPVKAGAVEEAVGAAEGGGVGVVAGAVKEEFVDVEDDMLGHVIGREGLTIKRIINESGAMVKVEKDASPSEKVPSLSCLDLFFR